MTSPAATMLMQPIKSEAAIVRRNKGPILSFLFLKKPVCGSGRVAEVHIDKEKEEENGEALLGDVRSTIGAPLIMCLKVKGKEMQR